MIIRAKTCPPRPRRPARSGAARAAAGVYGWITSAMADETLPWSTPLVA